jgi:hypothetical protein
LLRNTLFFSLPFLFCACACVRACLYALDRVKRAFNREFSYFLYRLLYSKHLMSAKSSFQRNSVNGLFPSLLNPDSHQPSSSGSLSSNINYASTGQQRSHQGLAPETNSLFRHQQRPVSEILKPESAISPESTNYCILNLMYQKLTGEL